LSVALLWLRRDLRLADNPALEAASDRHSEVLACFCFEPSVTAGRHACPARNAYLLAALTELERELRAKGGRLVFREGNPAREVPELAAAAGAAAVHACGDHTAHARRRDTEVARALTGRGIELVLHPGIACVEVGPIETQAGGPYRVFTPFHKAWSALPRRGLARTPHRLAAPKLRGADARSSVPAQSKLRIDAEARRIAAAAGAGETASRELLDAFMEGPVEDYAENRDRPDLDATSRLSAALHFGCLSARTVEERLAGRAGEGPRAFQRQLAWRDFFLHLTHHFPANSRNEHDRRFSDFGWRTDKRSLEAWQRGRTGVPMVDAGMRQLLSEGWMHNRPRMVTASFLTKHLLIDWRAGEAHFMHHLVDGDEASNNGNWQWAASTGADSQPYFRVFNPVRQQQQFDPDGVYVRRWLPELTKFPDARLAEPWKAPKGVQEDAGCIIGEDYPEPIVDLDAAREEAIARFGRHLEQARP
jgi:deoxyribodipyrimidine photo-lyase